MAKQPELPMTALVEEMHAALLAEGVHVGQRIKRDLWDDMVIVCMGVGHPSTIRNYTRVGAAKRLWAVTEAHGRGGRGFVTILGADDAHGGVAATA